MNSIAIVIIIIIIIIFIVSIYRNISHQKHRAQNHLATMDTNVARKIVEKELAPVAQNSDDLFTLALIHIHRADDAMDAQNMREWNARMDNARELMRGAIRARNTEHTPNQVTNIAIIDHANDIGLDVPQLEVQPIQSVKWTSDAENVHDSAVGDDVSHRITFLRANDPHVLEPRTSIGYVLRAMSNNNDIVQSPQAEDIKRRVRITANIMAQNNYCTRYQIGELDALCLVLGRIFCATNIETSQNIEASIIRAIADCAQDDGTVCLVGRITRIIGSLDIIDPDMPSLRSTDAYRAEIMDIMGTKTREKNGDISRADIEAILAPYRTILPTHIFNRIAQECFTAVDDG